MADARPSRIPDEPPPRPPPPWVVASPIRGTEQLRGLLKAGAPIQASTSGAPLRGVLSFVDLGPFGLAAGTLTASANCAGFCPPDVISATLVLSNEASGSINGAPLDRGAVLLFAPGAYYEGWSPAGYRWISCFLPREEARRVAADLATPPPSLRGGRALRARVPARDVARVEAFAEQIDLWRTRAVPEPLDAELARAQAELWRGLVGRAWSQGSPDAVRPIERRHEETLREADRWLRSRLGEPVYVADVAKAIGCPERTLEHTFRRRLGLSPLAYLRWLRLWEARKRLFRSTGRATAAIARCARAVGFGHPGRFSAAYRRTFGELPRDTIAVARDRAGRGAKRGEPRRHLEFAFDGLDAASRPRARWAAS